MKKITIKKATEVLKEMFGAVTQEEFRANKEHLSWYSVNNNGEVTFYIDKQQHERNEVIDTLRKYFLGKRIENVYCSVSGITLEWTTFELKKF